MTTTPPKRRITFDWRHSSHWGRRSAECRICNGRTRLLDDRGRPSHKTCAEAEANGDLDRHTHPRT